MTLHEEKWEFHFRTPNPTNDRAPCLLRITCDPRRASMPCERGIHKMPPSIENGTAREWQVSRKEHAFWGKLTAARQNSLAERQYDWCFLCGLDMEMP